MDAQIWTTLIAAGMLITILVGAGWTIMQAQFRALDQQRNVKDTTQDKAIDDIRHEIHRRELELKERLERTNDYILARIVQQDEFKQFIRSADDRWNTQAEINSKALESYLSVKAWEAWREERDKLIASIQKKIS